MERCYLADDRNLIVGEFQKLASTLEDKQEEQREFEEFLRGLSEKKRSKILKYANLYISLPFNFY